MKIAYTLAPIAVISGNANGIKSQARTWKKGLESKGHLVDEINVWGNYDWAAYDVVHIFGTGLYLYPFVSHLKKKNQNIVFSPIIDTLQSPVLYRTVSRLGSLKFKIWSPTFSLRKSLPLIKRILVRSSHEAEYFTGMIPSNLICKVPLSVSNLYPATRNQKEPFCLHISSITQPRKNVHRLIKAAIKYNFELVLAGSKGNPKDFNKLLDLIGQHKNIKVLGFISEEDKLVLYQRAKVFALPSLIEGVGIVALDAAILECEIVITDLGGPKEYYSNLAQIINPYDVDSIGKAIVNALDGSINYQPELSIHIKNNYSSEIVINRLEEVYYDIIKQ